MKKVTMKEYLLQSATTAKGFDSGYSFPVEEDRIVFFSSLARAMEAGDSLDGLKKIIFYGKRSEKALGKIRTRETGTKEAHKITEKHFDEYLELRQEDMDLHHAVLGVVSEVSEIIEAYLSYLKSGRIDAVNMKEELGDLMWYLAMMMRWLGTDFEDCASINLEKLLYGKQARYKSGGFSQEEAVDRNVADERELLEKVTKQ